MKRTKRNKVGEQKPVRSGWTLLKQDIDLKTRTALVLYVMGCYPMSEAYRIAFTFKGKPASLAPTACRWWHDPVIQEYICIFARCLSNEGYEVNPKITIY